MSRFLMDQPVEARPPSTWYRFSKFARRNKVAISTASMVAGALILGTALSVWQARVAVRERDEKEIALQQARAAEATANDARLELEEFTERLKAANILLASGGGTQTPNGGQTPMRLTPKPQRYNPSTSWFGLNEAGSTRSLVVGQRPQLISPRQ